MTAVFDLYAFVGIFTSGLSAFLILVLQSRKTRYRMHQTIIACLLFVLGFNVVHDTLVQAKLLMAFPHILYTGELPNLLIWPLVYLYLVLAPGQTISWKHTWHFIPFVLYNLSRLGDYFSSGATKTSVIEAFEKELMETGSVVTNSWNLTNFLNDFMLWRLQGLIYIAAILYFLFSQKKSPDRFNNAIMVFKIAFIGFTIIWLAKYGLSLLPYFDPMNALISNKVEILLNACQILLISFWTLKEPGHDVLRKEKSAQFVLSTDQLTTLKNNLKELFHTESLHLEHGITIHQVAKKLNTNANYISRVVNTEFQSSFTDWVNKNRVKEMQQRLKASQYDHLTIEAIARDSGFNSAITANRSFKKFMDMSPAVYRKQKQPSFHEMSAF